MCGLSGWFAQEPVDLARWLAAHRLLRHRGPDDAGVVTFRQRQAAFWRLPESHPAIGLPAFSPSSNRVTGVIGHYRLAIIAPDPDGHQPFADPDRRRILAYNGELYNYIELRNELASQGWTFVTRTDTEVVLAGLCMWGVEALSRFNGMWALALFDPLSDRLLLARDRFGIKPLFYRRNRNAFQFASELRVLRALGTDGLDEGAVAEYLSLGRIDHDDRTLLSDVRQLRPGHFLELDLATNRCTVTRWYVPPPPQRDAAGPNAAELRERLRQSVRLRLRSDVQVGTLLSGGLDSTTIAALVSALRDRDAPPLEAFSAVFDEAEFSEAPLIRSFVATQPRIRAHFVTLRATDLLASLDDVILAADSPVRSASVAAQWMLYRKIRNDSDVVVLLNGQGSDELFAGYTGHVLAALADAIEQRDVSHARDMMRILRRRGIGTPLVARRVAGLLWRQRRLRRRGHIDRSLRLAGRRLPWRAREPLLAQRVLDQTLRFNLLHSELPEYLRYDDRMSMAWSLEARLPFLDPDMVDLSMQLEPRQLISAEGGKQILRQAVADLLPGSIVQNPLKLGFPTPVTRWLRNELADAVADAIDRLDFCVPRDVLQRAWRKHDSDPFIWWRILSFVRWRDLGSSMNGAGLQGKIGMS